MSVRSSDSRFRRGFRILVAVVLLLAVGGLYGALVGQLKSATDEDESFVALERHGVAYLRPLTRLVGELTAAQSAAVRGAAVDTVALNAAVVAVSEVDRTDGPPLRTQQRWTDLRAAIDKVGKQRPTGPGALDAYADVVALATDLARKVGDTSKLILDPELDSYYLMDAAMLQLPAVLTAAGLAADLAYLTADRGKDDQLPYEGFIDVAVARQQVATATEATSTGIRKALDATQRGALGANLTEPLDAFRAAADQLVPPAALRQATPTGNSSTISAAAQKIRATAVPLAAAVLTELDALLAVRQDHLASQRIYALGAAGAGVALAVILLWWSVPARGRARSDELAAVTGRDEAGAAGDVASLSVQLPVVDARDLLALEELVHVGRGVRAQPKEKSDDAR